MKTFYGCLLLFFSSATSIAQTPDSIDLASPGETISPLLNPLKKPVLIAENNLGKIYRLPIDHMPCFYPHPELSIPIPTKKYRPVAPYIPNKVPR